MAPRQNVLGTQGRWLRRPAEAHKPRRWSQSRCAKRGPEGSGRGRAVGGRRLGSCAGERGSRSQRRGLKRVGKDYAVCRERFLDVCASGFDFTCFF